jgi:hypothetical protein
MILETTLLLHGKMTSRSCLKDNNTSTSNSGKGYYFSAIIGNKKKHLKPRAAGGLIQERIVSVVKEPSILFFEVEHLQVGTRLLPVTLAYHARRGKKYWYDGRDFLMEVRVRDAQFLERRRQYASHHLRNCRLVSSLHRFIKYRRCIETASGM